MIGLYDAAFTFIRLMDPARFFRMLGSDEMRAWYGPEHVALAVDRGAVGTLLISDELFRFGFLTRSLSTHLHVIKV